MTEVDLVLFMLLTSFSFSISKAQDSSIVVFLAGMQLETR